MAKKKSQSKKHKFKYAEPTGLQTSSSVREVPAKPVESGEVSKPKPGRVAAPAVYTRDFSYVGQDVRRIGVYAVSLVGLEVLLWYLFGHTGLGPAVYNLVQV